MNVYKAAAVFIIIFGLKFIAPILVYIIFSAFLTIILVPIFTYIDKKGLPAFIAYFITLTIFILIFITIFVLIDNSIQGFLSNLPEYQEKFNEYKFLVQQIINKYNLNISLENIDIFTIINQSFKKIGSIATSILIIIIGVSFLLFESKSFGRRISKIVNNKINLKNFYNNTQKYFLIKTFTSFLTGLFIGLMLYFFGVDFAFLFGFLAFLFNFIPVIGSIIASIPGISIALVTQDLWITFYVGLLYLVINIFISNILEPKIMGEGLDLSPAVIFFSLLFWGWIFGIIGTFLAVPLTMTLKLAFESSNDTKLIGELMSRHKKN